MPTTIGIITSRPEVIQSYFPTIAEPDFVPTEPHFTPDDQLAINDLRKHGMVVEPVVWGDNVEKLTSFDLLVVRSPWDYMDSMTSEQSFIKWVYSVEQEGVEVYNPGSLMHWLIDKHYLEDLHSCGINTIPTTYLTMGSKINLLEHFEIHGEFILKPCVSAGGIGLYHINNTHTATSYQLRINEYLKSTNYMVQPFIPEICTQGEWSVIFLGGEYSHTIHKKPAEDSIFVHAERGGMLDFSQLAPPHIVQFADETYLHILPTYENKTQQSCDPNDILYMRLDVIDSSDGPVLIECEGVEPELFFRACPESIVKFRNAIMRYL